VRRPLSPIVDDDPSDNMFIECAVKLKADFIVTGDKALRKIGKYKNIQILSPYEFLKVIDKKRL